jgi:hypothetical protein
MTMCLYLLMVTSTVLGSLVEVEPEECTVTTDRPDIEREKV